MRRLIVPVLALLLTGCACNSSSEAKCKDPKPGTIVTVNQYCAVNQNDPVDPALVADYKGQKVGFCCKGCIPKWNAMTDAQKDAAVASAVAKGKVKS